jgi:Cu(I)/Ag(I) efflux system membrane fusion protein
MAKTPESVSPARARRRFGLATLILVGLLVAALAGAGGYFIAQRGGGQEGGDSASPGPRYQCPMHPSIVQDHPGNCPICGMKLVPVALENAAPPAPDEAAGDEPAPPGLVEVSIDPARQQLIGLKTAPVERGPVGGSWRTVGRVAMDERRVRAVNLKVGGFVERVFVDFTGKAVAAGDPLFALYSPELLAAQEEYLLALKTQDALAAAGGMTDDGARLVAAARRRLELWDVPAAALAQLAESRQATRTLTFVSPIAGVVTRKDVVEGARLEAGAMPYEITDLSAVWVLADAYESELARLHSGMAATFTLAAYPGREFPGRVAFIDPVLDPATRTLKLRVELANPEGLLRPAMFGEVMLAAAPREVLRIPTDAIIDAGGEAVAFAALGGGRFAPRRLVLGEADREYTELIEGLAPGERVVTRANFLVDSESRLRASLATLVDDAAAPAAPAPTGHAGHTP